MIWTALALLTVVTTPQDRKEKTLAAEERWEKCVVDKAREMVGRGNPDLVAEAAFGFCEDPEAAFRQALKKWSKGFLGPLGRSASPERLDEMLEVERDRIRRKALGAAL